MVSAEQRRAAEEFAAELRSDIEASIREAEDEWRYVEVLDVSLDETGDVPLTVVVLRTPLRPGRLYVSRFGHMVLDHPESVGMAVSIGAVHLMEELGTIANGGSDERLDFEIVPDPTPPAPAGPPPAEVTAAVLEGGVYHSQRVPIDPGQAELRIDPPQPLPPTVTPEAARMFARPYRYVGEVIPDAEHPHGVAVFVPIG